MPAQQRLGLHEEARPAQAWPCLAARREEGAVGGLRGACYLATQPGELMAEHQDLEVLGGVAAGHQDEQWGGAAQRQLA